MALENTKILRIVFEHLNGISLTHAAKVCSLWSVIAEEENRRRGPYAVLSMRESTNPPPPWIIVKKQIIDSCPFKPFLNMFFVATGCEKRTTQECHCKLLPNDCYSLSLETFFPIENADMIKSMFFPKVPNIQISTVSLNEHSRENGIFCKELKFEFDLWLTEKLKFRELFDPFLSSENRLSTCMILFCDQLSLRLTDDIIKVLVEWYPEKKLSIWGGMLHELLLCENSSRNPICRETINLSLILMRGKHMETWTLTLGPYHKKCSRIIYRFKLFSQSVALRKHSIGFMFTADTRGERFYFFEIAQFEKHFPNVPLVKMCGLTAIAGDSFKETYRKIIDAKKLLKGKETSFLIISYDY